jgi:hypothetical protein
MADFLDSALSVLSMVAPGIATALGGPAAGLGVQALEAAFGLSPTGDKTAALQAVTAATPDQIIALKKVDNDFQARMKELDIDIFKTEVDDRKDSRARAVAMKDWTPSLIGLVIIAVWAGMNYFLLSSPVVPAVGGEVLGRVLGTLDAALMAFLYWIYGGSKTGDGLTRTLGDKKD